MSATQLVIDGASRAAQLVPLLFAPLMAAGAAAISPPAAAQLPRVEVVGERPAPAIALDMATEGTPLSLLAQHVDVQVIGGQARVRSTLTWRNDGSVPVAVGWRAPQGARVQLAQDGCGEVDELLEALNADDPFTAERIEAGDLKLALREKLLAPGEEVTLIIDRDATLLVRGDRHRLVLPLLTQRHGVFSPAFTASVSVDAERPIVDFGSGTHAAEISGVGDTRAQLVIPEGRVHEGQFLAVEFMLGEAASAAAPASASLPLRLAAWGGELRPRGLR